MPEAEVIQALTRIVGEDGVLTQRDRLRAYETAARYGSGRAAAVVRPADVGQVSKVVAYCVTQGIRFVPQSANTGLVLGSTPDESGEQIVLSLERLRAPLRIDAADRTVEVGAGVNLSTLNTSLAPHGLFLPIDLGADPMIGGMIATNTAGARFIRYGDMRRHVLGLQVVLADEQGTVLELGRGLRKDNSGLALGQVFIGSCGALGIVTRATLEVHPLPVETAAALLVPRDEEALMELLNGIERMSEGRLSAFEGMSRAALQHAFTHVQRLRNPFAGGEIPAWTLLVELSRNSPRQEGETPLDEQLQDMLARLSDGDNPPLTDAVFAPAESLWAIRHSLSEGLRASGSVIGFDLSFKRTTVMRFRRAAAAMLARDFPELELCDFGHVGDGGIHFNLLLPAGQPLSAERRAALREAVLDLAINEFHGTFSGEHGVGRSNQDAYDRFTPAPVQALSAGLVELFSRSVPAAVRFGTKTA